MIREFTRKVGRFESGERRDYPQTTWDGIAQGEDAKLDSFSKPVEMGPVGAKQASESAKAAAGKGAVA